jgi:hypothetical protein
MGSFANYVFFVKFCLLVDLRFFCCVLIAHTSMTMFFDYIVCASAKQPTKNRATL